MTQGMRPRVIDNGRGAVLVTFEGKQLRGWSYQSAAEQKIKTGFAREYVEGWMEGSIHNSAR